MKDKLTLTTKLLLDFMFYAGILVTITLPLSIKFYGRYNSYFANNYIPLILLFSFPAHLPFLLFSNSGRYSAPSWTMTALSGKMSSASAGWVLTA